MLRALAKLKAQAGDRGLAVRMLASAEGGPVVGLPSQSQLSTRPPSALEARDREQAIGGAHLGRSVIRKSSGPEGPASKAWDATNWPWRRERGSGGGCNPISCWAATFGRLPLEVGSTLAQAQVAATSRGSFGVPP